MPFIIALDYDDTIAENAYPEIGTPVEAVIQKALEFRANPNCEIILWTCREGEKLKDAVDRCKKEFNLWFDAVNDNSPSQKAYIERKLKETGHMLAQRKIFANIYVDDRAPGSIEFFLKIDVEKTCKNFINE